MNDSNIEKVALPSFFSPKISFPPGKCRAGSHREIFYWSPRGKLTADYAEHIKCSNQSRLLQTVDKAELLDPNCYVQHSSNLRGGQPKLCVILLPPQTVGISNYNTPTEKARKKTFAFYVKQLQLGWIGMADVIRLIFIRQNPKDPMAHDPILTLLFEKYKT